MSVDECIHWLRVTATSFGGYNTRRLIRAIEERDLEHVEWIAGMIREEARFCAKRVSLFRRLGGELLDERLRITRAWWTLRMLCWEAGEALRSELGQSTS